MERDAKKKKDAEDKAALSKQMEVLKKRAEELLADTKAQLVNGHAEMKGQIVEAVESAVAGLKTDLARAEGGRQHFVNSLAEAMNAVTSLRYKYQDYEDWEHVEEEYDEYDLSKRYKDDAGDREAAGV